MFLRKADKLSEIPELKPTNQANYLLVINGKTEGYAVYTYFRENEQIYILNTRYRSGTFMGITSRRAIIIMKYTVFYNLLFQLKFEP